MPRGRILRTFNGLRSVDDNAGAILRQLVVKELFPGDEYACAVCGFDVRLVN